MLEVLRGRVHRPAPGTAMGFVALVVAIGGVGYAAIPDGSGVIHGCYATATGSLRVIDAPTQACAANETALSWNQQGAKGDAGLPGPPGADAFERIVVVTKVSKERTFGVNGIELFCPKVPGPHPRQSWTAVGGGAVTFEDRGSPWIFQKENSPIISRSGVRGAWQPVGWRVIAASFSPGAASAVPSFRLRAWALCVPPPGVELPAKSS